MRVGDPIGSASARVDKHALRAIACDAVTVERMRAMKVLWNQDEASCRSAWVTVLCVWPYLQRCVDYAFVVRASRARPLGTM